MKTDKKHCCGTCKHHHPDGTWPDDWICVNADSEHVADWTEYEDSCEHWEARDEKGRD